MKFNANSDYEFAKKLPERYFQNKRKLKSLQRMKSDFSLLVKSSEDTNYPVFASRKAEIIKYLPEETYTEFDAQLKLEKIVEQSIDDKIKKNQ